MTTIFDIILQSQYASGTILAVVGVIIGHIASRYSNKMAVLNYTVATSKLGETTENNMHGSIEVRHMGRPLPNFYFSTISLRNGSNTDLDNVTVCFFVGDGVSILTDFIAYKKALSSIPYSPEYHAISLVPDHLLRLDRREYRIPVLNRGQEITLELTLTHLPAVGFPAIHATLVHKGAKLIESPNRHSFHGVPTSRTLPWAIIIGLFLYGSLCGLAFISPWITGLACLLYGFFAQTFSAYFLKSADWIRVKMGLLPSPE